MPDTAYTDREMLYFLSGIPALGPVSIARLYETILPLSDLLKLDDLFLLAAGLNENQVSCIRAAAENLDRILSGMERFRERGIFFITCAESGFPERLKKISAPPPFLFYMGNLPPDGEPAAAVVGSRNATEYGTEMARFIASELSRSGIAVISGMAVGIDAASHRGALREGKKTYAVLGNGVNICYPRENYDIYSQLSSGDYGGIISEFPPDTKPLPSHFPRRNRIIAGLSDVLVVTEARGPKSGSQITVDQALEQGKEVFAVPGRITDPLSRGCNDLIRNGASILTTPDDVKEAIGLKRDGKLRIPSPQKLKSSMDPEQKKIYAFLLSGPRFTDDIIERTGLSAGKTMNLLLRMELEGLIVQTSGNYYAVSCR